MPDSRSDDPRWLYDVRVDDFVEVDPALHQKYKSLYCTRPATAWKSAPDAEKQELRAAWDDMMAAHNPTPRVLGEIMPESNDELSRLRLVGIVRVMDQLVVPASRYEQARKLLPEVADKIIKSEMLMTDATPKEGY